MACTGCKKKKKQVEIIEAIDSLSYQLRDGITWSQIGIKAPTDENIKAFLDVNPNRKSLFKVIPVINNEQDNEIVNE